MVSLSAILAWVRRETLQKLYHMSGFTDNSTQAIGSSASRFRRKQLMKVLIKAK